MWILLCCWMPTRLFSEESLSVNQKPWLAPGLFQFPSMKDKLPIGFPTVTRLTNHIIDKVYEGKVNKIQYGMIYNMCEAFHTILFDLLNPVSGAYSPIEPEQKQVLVPVREKHQLPPHYIDCPKCKAPFLNIRRGHCASCGYHIEGFERDQNMDLDNS